MDEHDDDLESEVDDDETDGFPQTAEEIENAADERPETDDEQEDPSEL